MKVGGFGHLPSFFKEFAMAKEKKKDKKVKPTTDEDMVKRAKKRGKPANADS